LIDLNNLSHPSVELQGIFPYCSLDSSVLIVNLYRHPNSKTLSIVTPDGSFFRTRARNLLLRAAEQEI